MKNQNYKIYMHRNKINGKVYIGQTKQELNDRWQNGNGYKKSPKFYNAIQKYGWNNFEHFLLECNLTYEQANKKEVYYINKFKSCDRNFGYNISTGGAGSPIQTETIYQYSLDGNFIKSWNSITDICEFYKIVNSGIYKCLYGEISYYHGYQWKKYYSEKIEKVEDKAVAISNKKKKKIYQYSLEGYFIKSYDSATDAKKDGFNDSRIRACCNGNIMSSYGYQWRDYYKTKIDAIDNRYVRQAQSAIKKVYQYDKNGIFLRSYNSLKEASDITGLNYKNISACCRGVNNTCGGFKWSYDYYDKILNQIKK